MKIVSAFALAFVGIVACSSSDDAASSADKGAAVNAICDNLQKCLPAGIKAAFGDVATCKSQTLASANDPADRPPGAVDPSKAVLDACVAAVQASSCDDGFLPDECDFRGSLADGAACADSSQCAGGLCVQKDSGCGTCGKIGVEGSVCGDTQPCGAKLTCVGGTCKARLATGVTCSDSTAECASGLRCISGACATALAAGADCAANATGCGFGLFCDGAKCVTLPEPTFAVLGGDCGTPGTLCSVSRCDDATKKCVAFAKLGEACPTGEECGSGLDCDPTTKKCVHFLTCN